MAEYTKAKAARKSYEQHIEETEVDLQFFMEEVAKFDYFKDLYVQTKDTYDLNNFEYYKKEFIDIFCNISDIYSRMGFRHIIAEQGRKIKKSKVLNTLSDQGMTITKADKTVYTEKEYLEFMNFYLVMEEAHDLVKNRYYAIRMTVDSIKQSIGIARNIEN